MKLTVAIPSYNKEKYISRCLDSIVANKADIEKIILIDNCSADKTFEIANGYEPTITCLQNSSNLGMSGNWNRCIDECETEWLMIFHADDIMLPGAIAHYTKIIESHPTISLIHANSFSMIENNIAEKTFNEKNQKEFWTAGADALKCHYGVCSAVMVKKEAYTKLGYFINKSLSSDAEMWSRVAGSYDVGFIKEPTVIYNVNEASIGLHSLTTRSVKDIKEDWDILNEQTASHYPTEEGRKHFMDEARKHAPGTYFNVVKANLRARNYIKALQATKIIVIDYSGLFPLLGIIFCILVKNLVNLSKKLLK